MGGSSDDSIHGAEGGTNGEHVRSGAEAAAARGWPQPDGPGGQGRVEPVHGGEDRAGAPRAVLGDGAGVGQGAGRLLRGVRGARGPARRARAEAEEEGGEVTWPRPEHVHLHPTASPARPRPPASCNGSSWPISRRRMPEAKTPRAFASSSTRWSRRDSAPRGPSAVD